MSNLPLKTFLLLITIATSLFSQTGPFTISIRMDAVDSTEHEAEWDIDNIYADIFDANNNYVPPSGSYFYSWGVNWGAWEEIQYPWAGAEGWGMDTVQADGLLIKNPNNPNVCPSCVFQTYLLAVRVTINGQVYQSDSVRVPDNWSGTMDTRNVTIQQKRENQATAGNIGKRIDSDIYNYPAPQTFYIPTTITSEVFRGSQGLAAGTNDKYKLWSGQTGDISNIVNHKSLELNAAQQEYISQIRTAQNATIQAQLHDNATSVSIDFKDPWYPDDNSDPLGLRNRGTNPIPHTVSYSSNNIGLNSVYKGVFLNQDPNIPGNPYYSIRSQQTQTISSYTSNFYQWSTSSATITSPNNIVSGYYESPVVFTGSNASVTAKYKAYQASASVYATGSTNQRKLAVLTLSGTTTHHLVYESGGDIWYASSTNGMAWTNEVLVSDGSGNNLNPSLDVYNVSNTVFVNVVWVNTSNATVYLRQKTNSTWTSQEAVPVSEPTPGHNPSSWYPVTARGYVAYNRYHSSGSAGAIVVKNRTAYTVWQNAGPVPGTGASSKNPSVVYGSTGHCHVAYEDGGVIKYNKVIYTGGSSYSWGSTEQVSPSGWTFNSDASLTLQYGPGGNPVVAWQSFGNVTGGSSVHIRNKPNGWGVVQSYSYSNQTSIRPTLGSVVGDFSLSVMWYNSSTQTVVRGTYNGSSWSSAATVASGTNSGWYPNMTVIGPSFSSSRVVWRKNTTWPLAYASTGMAPPPDPKIVGGDEERIGKVQFSVDEETTEYDVIDNAEPLPYVWSRTGLIDLAQAIEAADEMNYEEKSEGPPSGTIGFELTGIALGSEQIPFSIVTDTAEQAVRYSSKPFMVSGATSLTIAGTVSGNGLYLPSQLFSVSHSPLATVVAKKSSTGETVKTVGMVPFAELEDVETSSFSSSKLFNADLSAFAGEEIYLEITMLGESGGAGPVIVDNFLIDGSPSNLFTTEEQAEEKSASDNPTGFELHQNYPNPFNPETEIGFTVPEQSHVSITIMDILGREVADLGNRSYSPGYGRVRWNGTDKTGSKVGSGMYFYRITAVGESGRQFSKTMKMVLAK